MSDWEILGIEPTDDKNAVRKAYAEKSKMYHPETHPEEFKKLYNAYKAVSARLKAAERLKVHKQETEVSEVVIPVAEHKEEPNNQPGSEKIVLKPVPAKNPQMPNVAIEEDKKQAEKKATEKKAVTKELTAKDREQYASFVEDLEQAAKNNKQNKLNDAELNLFEDMLDNQYYQEEWRKFFLRPAFLEQQYDPEYIHALAERIEKKLKEKVGSRGGRIPQFAMIYMIIAYGCMFDKIGRTEIKEEVYKKELLGEYVVALRLYAAPFSTYVETEIRTDLSGERLAFYVYRNLLALLERDKPDKTWLRFWLKDGLVKESNTHLLALCHHQPVEGGAQITPTIRRMRRIIRRSSIIFELLAFLLSRKRKNLEVFEDVLESVCLSDVGADAREEKQLLLLMIDENRRKRREGKM